MARVPGLVRAVSLLDLTGSWPMRAGASMAIYSVRAACPAMVAGDLCRLPGRRSLYTSSLDANRPAVMLDERAASALAEPPHVSTVLWPTRL